jgi:phage N-6-adenine-methyltransferase
MEASMNYMESTNVSTQMTADEARQKTQRIKDNLTETRSLLLEMYERRGWESLGYSSWREYGQVEFGYSESRVYELMNAAKVERNISAMAENTTPIPERHLRPLTSLPPKQQAEAYETAVSTAANGKVTAAHVTAVVGKVRSAKPHVSNNSGNNEWYTPSEYIEAARAVMGRIDLDPASSKEANRVVKAAIYYTVEDDGLSQAWAGRVWMNPPYATNLIGKFSSKLVNEYKNGNVEQAIVLVNNATETGWFVDMINQASAVCFPTSRVRFWRPDGETGAPLQGQAIIYMGDNPHDFSESFSSIGWCAHVR